MKFQNKKCASCIAKTPKSYMVKDQNILIKVECTLKGIIIRYYEYTLNRKLFFKTIRLVCTYIFLYFLSNKNNV